MNRIAKFIAASPWLSGVLALLLSSGFGLLASQGMRDLREAERLQQLQTEAERRGIEIMSQTLNGNLMGAVAVLGLINGDIKQEALGKREVNTPQMLSTLESIARVYGADGVFIVTGSGIAGTSWDNSGKPSSGLNLKFRPYYRMAMQGMENVYAAVSIARGDRSLYFTAPIFRENTSWTTAIGAVVARTNLQRVDELLKGKGDIALLLSPQGVVFASSRPEWIGHLAHEPTAERIREIRELKQFGKLFDERMPSALPLSINAPLQRFEDKRFVLTKARVQWNDPAGDWQLVMLEDLDRTVSPAEYGSAGVAAAVLVLLLCLFGFNILRSQIRQQQANALLAQFAEEQQASVARKTRLAAAMVRMQRTDSPAALAAVFFDESHHLFACLQGVLYVSAADVAPDTSASAAEKLQLAGSYACADPVPAEIACGEGLLGQCAIQRQRQLITLDTGRYAMLRSGLGETAPAAVLLAPVQLSEKLLGVVELALAKLPDETQQGQLDELLGLLAMNIEIVNRSVQTGVVLSATRAAEQRIAEQLAFQQALVDTIPYPVFYKDAESRFLGFNRAYEETFAVERDALIGKRVLDLDYLPEADRIAYQAEDEAMIASIGQCKREMKIPFADGKLHETLYFVSAFQRADGSPGGLVGTFIDISEMKQAQSELARLSDAERFNRLAQGREARILQLKQEINTLCLRLSEAPRYATADQQAQPVDDQPELPLGEHLKLVNLNWHATYDCGQPDIDREHHALFAIANQLINATVAGQSPAAIDAIIQQLVRETTQHFAHEEAILQAQGYAELAAHAAIHRELIDKAVHLIGEFKSGRLEAGPFFQFLAYDVIARHMLGEDRKFFPLFQDATDTATAAPAQTAIPGLAELVDLDELQRLFSAFCESVGIAAAIIDLDAKVLASSRWQRACTDYHRVNPDSCARCIESDTQLALKLQDGQDYTIYQCKNGMTDCASPIILEGHHLANVFIGQFHLGPPDMEFFRQQARQFGYPEAEYLQAIADAPVADEKRLPVILGFLSGFARMISTMSLARYRADQAHRRLQQQTEQLHRERIAALSLAEDAEQSRIALEAINKEPQA